MKNEVGWLSIFKTEDNFVNKIFGLLYKPEYYIRLKFKNNVIKQFKIIPNITSEGFIITPLINNNVDYFLFNKSIENTMFQKVNEIKEIMIYCKNFKLCVIKI